MAQVLGDNMDKCALFAATLLHSSTNTHFFHWSTNSYAEHIALGEYYDEIIDLVDDFMEAVMGRYNQVKKFPNVYHEPKNPLQYMESLKKFVEESRDDLPQDQDIQTLVDNIAILIDSTLYKIRFLK